MRKYDCLLVHTFFAKFGMTVTDIFAMPHLGLGYLGAVLER